MFGKQSTIQHRCGQTCKKGFIVKEEKQAKVKEGMPQQWQPVYDKEDHTQGKDWISIRIPGFHFYDLKAVNIAGVWQVCLPGDGNNWVSFTDDMFATAYDDSPVRDMHRFLQDLMDKYPSAEDGYDGTKQIVDMHTEERTAIAEAKALAEEEAEQAELARQFCTTSSSSSSSSPPRLPPVLLWLPCLAPLYKQ